MGTTGFVAQADGQGDEPEVRAAAGRVLLMATAISGLHLILTGPIEEDEWNYNFFDHEPAWREFDTALARFADVARTFDACALMLIHTHLDDLGPNHPYRPIYNRVTEAAESHGVAVQETFSYHA